MNQYEDLFDSNTGIIPIAKARYVPRIESTNIYVTALPPPRDNIELAYDNNKSPGLPDVETFKAMPNEQQIKLLTKIKNSRICLPYYQQIEENVDRALTDSYERRASILRDRPSGFYTYKDKEIETCQHSQIKQLGDAPLGFAIIGESGCGKTNGIHNVLQKYPQAIIHNSGTMQQHIQIPIVLVEMPENSNFHGLYTAIGLVIDRILGNTYVYEKELSRKGTLSEKFFRLRHILEVFNVGLLLIDEIEHMSKKRISEGTLETFMSLSNQTGTAIGVIGTQESFNKLFYEPRVARRMGEFINADSYHTNKKQTTKALRILYSYLPYEVPLTDGCINVYQRVTDGIIFYILQLFIHVAVILFRNQQRNNTTICKRNSQKQRIRYFPTVQPNPYPSAS